MTQIDSSSDDDDSSPEEEGLRAGQQEIQLQLRERKEAQRREQKILKEQRRKQDEMFRKQREKKLRTGSMYGALEEMPIGILENSKKEKQIHSTKREAPRHITFHGEVGEGTCRKKNKLAVLKVKRGPVTVQLLSKGSQLPPKTERSVMRDREKWLRRRSVRRK